MNERHRGLGLADFLTDLRAELDEAQSRAVDDQLKLSVDEVSVTLDVAYTASRTGEGSVGVKAKFWVLEFGEASAKGSVKSERADTQRITLKLKPRIEELIIDEDGRRRLRVRGVDVSGHRVDDEETLQMPSQ